MGYTRASSIVRFGLIALVAAQLGGCATARGVTRGAGTALGVAGALALLVAVEPDCDPNEDLCPTDDEPYYDEETIDTRAAIAVGGGAAVVLGGALVAASSTPKRKAKRRAAAKPAPAQAAVAAPATAPDPAHAAAMRALIEKRCVPPGGIDLRVLAGTEEEPSSLPACEISGPAAAPSPEPDPSPAPAAPSAPPPP